MANLQVAGIGGGVATAVFFNVPVGMMMLSPILASQSAKAKGVLAGMTLGFQAGAGAMYYHGYISLHG